MHKPELLAPAGSLDKLKVALAYGADAVFLGAKSFGLRAFSDNFSWDEMAEGVSFAHKQGKKTYVTVNVFPHNDDLVKLPEYLDFLTQIAVDGVIVADPGIFQLARTSFPKLPLHISTQANTTNWRTAQFWQEQGAKRVVLARELNLTEISQIRTQVSLEMEAFVHGAMCMSYSGRCLLSNYLTDRDANRGECAQPCRWKYQLVEEKRPGQAFPIEEDEHGTYILNSKDLCMLEHLPALLSTGINSLKIEGRMKSIHYVATVTKVYRQAIDAYLKQPDSFQIEQNWIDELHAISHRKYSTGFYIDTTGPGQIYDSNSHEQTHDFIGLVLDYDPKTRFAYIEQRNNLKLGQEIELLRPVGQSFAQRISEMYDADGLPIEVAPHPQQKIRIRMEQPVEAFAMLRRRIR